MKKILFFALLLFFNLQGQQNASTTQKTIEIGDILIIGKPSAQLYQHIRFPKTNFIIKKGGIPNYKALVGDRVIVTKVDKKQQGYSSISFKLENGDKFFNSITVVKANFEKALEEKEILLVK